MSNHGFNLTKENIYRNNIINYGYFCIKDAIEYSMLHMHPNNIDEYDWIFFDI